MKEEKGNVKDWYAIGWLFNGETEIESVGWMTETEAKKEVIDLYKRNIGLDYQTYYANIEANDGLKVFSPAWYTIKRRGEENE